jgi:hypothetical protein
MSDKKLEQLVQLAADLRKEAAMEIQDYKTVDLGRAKREVANRLRKILGTK